MSNVKRQNKATGEPRTAGQLPRHRVREAIKQQILDGANLPGEWLKQDQLAKQFNVSRGVVREALMELQAGGWVQTTANCGAKVTSLDPDRLMEAFELREVLEGLAARRCCDRMTIAQLRELHELTDAMDRHYQAREWHQGGLLARQFRLRLIEISGSTMLNDIAEGCLTITKFVTVEIEDVAQPAEAQRELLAIIASGDAALAEQTARAQVNINRRNYERSLTDGTKLHWLIGSKSTEAPDGNGNASGSGK